MKKSFFLAIGFAALLTACNNNDKPAAEAAEPAKETPQVNVVVEQPKQEAPEQKVEIDNNGVKINVTDPSGNKIEINAKDPK